MLSHMYGHHYYNQNILSVNSIPGDARETLSKSKDDVVNIVTQNTPDFEESAITHEGTPEVYIGQETTPMDYFIPTTIGVEENLQNISSQSIAREHLRTPYILNNFTAKTMSTNESPISNSTSHEPKSEFYKQADAMMKDIQELAQSFPDHRVARGFFKNVSALLAEPWKPDPDNITLFRYVNYVDLNDQ